MTTVAKRLAHPRTFDVLLARQLVREEGLSYAEVARRLGVSGRTVRVAVDMRQRLRSRHAQRDWMRQGVCACGKSKSRNAKRCLECDHEARITSVREHTLRCAHCREWKPDEDFHRAAREVHRRGRKHRCRKCSSAERRGELMWEDAIAQLRRLHQQQAEGLVP